MKRTIPVWITPEGRPIFQKRLAFGYECGSGNKCVIAEGIFEIGDGEVAKHTSIIINGVKENVNNIDIDAMESMGDIKPYARNTKDNNNGK